MGSVLFLIHKGGVFTEIAEFYMDDIIIIIVGFVIVIVIINLKSKP